MKTDRNCNQGFTLVELVIVIAIIGVMLGLGAPALLGALPGMRASGAARELLADVRQARTLAVEKGVDVLVKFNVDKSNNPAAGTYIVAVDVTDNGDFDPGTDELVAERTLGDTYEGLAFSTSDPAAGAATVATGVDLGGGSIIVFEPRGSTTASGSVYLMPAADAGGRTDRNRRVTVVTTATGNARIERLEGGIWQ